MLEYYFNIDDDIYRLPVNPKSFALKSGANIEEIDMTSTGKVTLFSGKEVDAFTLKSFWPVNYMPYCNHSGFRSSEEFKSAMLDAKNKGKQVRVIVTEIGINKLFYIKKFDTEWDEGTASTILKYDIEAIECSNPEIPAHIENIKDDGKSIVNKKNENKKRIEGSKTKKRESKNKTYTVKRGDCLWSISRKYYGNGSLYKKIINANKGKINGILIHPGQKLVIPDVK